MIYYFWVFELVVAESCSGLSGRSVGLGLDRQPSVLSRMISAQDVDTHQKVAPEVGEWHPFH